MKRSYEVADPRSAHLAALNLWQHEIKPWTSTGGAGRLTWEPSDPTSRAAMRRLFHGPILKDFAEQVWLREPDTDRLVRYAPAAWKVYLRDLFCPARFDADGHELPKSTEALSDHDFATFLTEVQAFGVVDWGVVFTEQPEFPA